MPQNSQSAVVDAKVASSIASKVTEIPPVEGITQAPVVAL